MAQERMLDKTSRKCVGRDASFCHWKLGAQYCAYSGFPWRWPTKTPQFLRYLGSRKIPCRSCCINCAVACCVSSFVICRHSLRPLSSPWPLFTGPCTALAYRHLLQFQVKLLHVAKRLRTTIMRSKFRGNLQLGGDACGSSSPPCAFLLSLSQNVSARRGPVNHVVCSEILN